MSDQRISKNKAVQFTYTITVDSGEVVEQVDLPVNYVHGASDIGLIESIERAMDGKCTGDKITVEVSPEDGFGEYDSNLTFEDDMENVPPQFCQVGAKVEMANDEGDTKQFTVTKVADGKVTVDGNHPHAGKKAFFNVVIVSVRDATDDEIRNGIDNPKTAIH